MLNKNDPLIGAVQEIMKRNEAERNAARLVNEKFGVTDRKALPHEKQSAWDAAYKTVLNEGVEALDEKIKMTQQQMANLDGKKEFTANDLRHLRAGTHIKKAAAGELEEAQKMNIDAAVAARKTSKMADKAKTPEEREELLAKMRKYKSQVRMQEERMNIDAAVAARKTAKMADKAKTPEEREELERKSKMYKSQVRMKEETATAPKTDPYAEQQAGSVSSVSKPKPTTSITPPQQNALKKKIQSIMKEGAKVERMVRHIKTSEIEAGMSPEKAKNIAWATVNKRGMLNNKNKKMNEGFNNRHNSSVNASAGKQIVAELTAYPGTPAGTSASSTSNSMMATQARLRAGEAAQARLAAARSRATSATDTAPQPQSGATSLARQQSGDTAPRPQPNMALQRRQSGDTAPRPQSSVALQRRQSGDTAPKPQPNMALQRQQSGDVAPRPQNSSALQRQQAGQQARMGGNPTGAPNSSALPKKVVPTGNPNKAGSGGNVGGAPKPKLRPANATATAAGARRQQPVAGSQRRAQTPTRLSALQRQIRNSKNYRDSAVTGPGGKRG